MADRRVAVAIVGGGLAGLAAASVLGRHGVGVLVLDDNRHPGGQYLRGGRTAGGFFTDGVRRRGFGLIDGLARERVEVVHLAEVVGIEPGFELLVAAENDLFAVKADQVLLATGARERFLPFLGWTLSGVLSTGAVQVLIKQSGVLPARDILVAGAGLFPTAVAADIVTSGGRVPAVLDEARLARRLPLPLLFAGQVLKFARGGLLLARLLAAGVRVRHRVRILEAHGERELRAVTAARIDRRGALVPGSEMVMTAACLAVGFGFTANTELAQLAGCRLTFDPALGGVAVAVDPDLETGVAGLFAAGEVTGIGGAAKSLAEGRLAGIAILRQRGVRFSRETGPGATELRAARRRQLAFARYFNAQHTFGPEWMQRWVSGLSDDVVVCRCEGVRLGALRRAVAAGFEAPAGLKKATRCGMGLCQGSTCRMILLEVLAALTGKPLAEIPPPSVRMPVKPVLLGALAGGRS
ncbi:MAG: FAD-dependent oxidoreductase [Desulfobacterales bacterium]|jgi:NADPH-dependent 2,4-dienoyl-CoA reductase/sulfur reductase-like enzyme|nr:FAD-dependent oxidoreductase [Desulfobacterales bacterium]